ncbi:MAG TPA: hypothetical protein VFG95_02285 [Nitrospiria bacterium]|nr:hypothetical protein [Nitrospiria bacterium]
MPLYDPLRNRMEVKAVPPAVKAAIVHAFLHEVQNYAEKMLHEKWTNLEQKRGCDPELIGKFTDWLVYHRFNEIAIKEIEEGTLDDWFERLF